MEANERFKEKAENEEELEEEIWSWGAGTEGQLGTGRLLDEHHPQFLRSLSSLGPVSLLACGGAHVIALISGGRVVTWGRGTSGQLGHREAVSSVQPMVVEDLVAFDITYISAGWNHSGFVSESGQLFMCGDGTFGQLGLGDYISHSSPVEVPFFNSRHVKQIACGMRHSIALVEGNMGSRVYGFGSGKRGQLGISDDKVKSVSVPHVTLGLENLRINSIIANGEHSGAICTDGHFYRWGRGFGGGPDNYMPKRITASPSFSSASIGWNHALLLTGDGQVFMMGSYNYGASSSQKTQLIAKTLKDAGNEEIAQKVDALVGVKVFQISAGAEHTALVTDDGSVMTWGWGEHGQLGLGDANDQASPQVVSTSNNMYKHVKKPFVVNVYCGSGFTFVIKRHMLESVGQLSDKC
ncbi:unnamed protein product [Cuscuta europaea]|uniref:RCC1-like domain-containing protein n=1 Tax=Cuscuta europaea TaxID=41803 RepID=A0A9P1EM23_CUSEU|nr:unnamed protein product [Cuscuta europaea]